MQINAPTITTKKVINTLTGLVITI